MKNSKPSLKRDDVIALLKASKSELEKFKVKSLLIFGSVARDEANNESDVDLLVEFEQTKKFKTARQLNRER